MFYPDDTSTYDASPIAQLSEKSRIYQKEVKQRKAEAIEEVSFWVGKERFVFKPNQHAIDTLKMHELEKDLIKTVQEALQDYEDSDFMMKNDTYKKLFIVEPIEDGGAIRYQVNWMAYEE